MAGDISVQLSVRRKSLDSRCNDLSGVHNKRHYRLLHGVVL